MKLIGLIIKSTLVGVAAYYLCLYREEPSSILKVVGYFFLMYRIIICYTWCFRENGFSFIAYLGKNGLIMTVFSLCFMLFVSVLAIAAPFYLLTYFLPYDIAGGIFGGVIIIAAIVCIIKDIVVIARMFIRLFKPRHYEED